MTSTRPRIRRTAARTRTLLLTAALVGVGLGATACALPSNGVTTAADSTSGGTAAPGGTAAANGSGATAPHNARVGDAITIDGMKGEKLTVTVVKVVYGVHSTDGFSKPDDGNRYVAVQFRLTNAGSSAYSDAPMNDAKVLDAAGQSFDPDFADTSAGPSLSSQVNIAPGGSQLGYLTFQIPSDDKVATVQFTTDSGFGSTGQWAAA